MAYATDVREKVELGAVIDRIRSIHLAVPLLVVMLYLWLNGVYHWGAYWEENTALAYVIMMGFVLSVGASVEYANRKETLWLKTAKLGESVTNFMLGFLGIFALIIILDTFIMRGAFSGNTISPLAVAPAVALTVFFVAPVEETIFRGYLKNYFKGWKVKVIPVAPLVTSGAFALMHVNVYGGATGSLLWAFLMGLVFYGVSEVRLAGRAPLGVAGSIGAHVATNLAIIGVLLGGVLA